jgi:lipopolysaccharide biosynthesis glycosyltransferase
MSKFIALWVLLLLLIFVNSSASQPNGNIYIVAVVDQGSLLACFIKFFSLLRSSATPNLMVFGLVVFESPHFTTFDVSKKLDTCFNDSGARFELVPWHSHAVLSKLLRHEKFETELIYCRFYLPSLFPTWDKFVYLDNDLVVNMDVRELFEAPLLVMARFEESQTSALGQGQGQSYIHSRNKQMASTEPFSRSSKTPPRLQGNRVLGPAVVAFVFERHPFYRRYMHAHFNFSSHEVLKVLGSAEIDVFLNAGVFVVDARRWRQLNLTAQAEALVLRNRQQGLYSASIGDQGLFYLLLQRQMAFLPARFNMRRLPRRSLSLLEGGANGEAGMTGVVHFAGIMHHDSLFLCRYPLLHPVLWPAALPLYLSISMAFAQTCPALALNTTGTDGLQDMCSQAVEQLQQVLREQQVRVSFQPGRGVFLWPPPAQYSTA